MVITYYCTRDTTVSFWTFLDQVVAREKDWFLIGTKSYESLDSGVFSYYLDFQPPPFTTIEDIIALTLQFKQFNVLCVDIHLCV